MLSRKRGGAYSTTRNASRSAARSASSGPAARFSPARRIVVYRSVDRVGARAGVSGTGACPARVRDDSENPRSGTKFLE